MLNLLGAISTETIIGIVAIVIIVISVAIIVAVAVRNYLLHKKYVAENGIEEGMEEPVVQEIDENNVEIADTQDSTSAGVSEQEIEDATQNLDIKAEFADEESLPEEPVQEIDLANNDIVEDKDNKINVDDIKKAELSADEIADNQK